MILKSAFRHFSAFFNKNRRAIRPPVLSCRLYSGRRNENLPCGSATAYMRVKFMPIFVNVKSSNRLIIKLYILLKGKYQTMKKLLLILMSLVLVMALVLCGCRNNDPDNNVGDDVKDAADDVVDGVENGVDDIRDGVDDIIDQDGDNYADDGVIDDNGVNDGVITDNDNNTDNNNGNINNNGDVNDQNGNGDANTTGENTDGNTVNEKTDAAKDASGRAA